MAVQLWLLFAEYKEHLAIVETFIATESEVDFKDKDGDTALNLGIKNHHQKITLVLLDAGANFPDITESLILAIREGNIEAVKILMSIHHNLNAPKQDGETPIMLAAAER